MHAALGGVHVVGKGDHHLVIAVVVLHGHLGHSVLLGPGHVDHVGVEGVFVPVDEGDKLPDAPLIAHVVLLLPAGAQVHGLDAQSGVEEGLLPHAGVEGVVVVLQGVEHLRVGLEGDGGAGVVGLAHHGHLLGDLAPGELHLIDLPVLVDLDLQPLAQGVDHRRAHAVEAAGHLIAAAAELAAGVEDGEHHLQGGPAGLGLDVHGDAPAVVGDGDGVPRVDGHGDVGAVARQGLVDGVVHDLIHQVVQARLAGGADVHAGALAHRLQPLQHLDLRAAVFMLHLRGIQFQFFCHNNLQVLKCRRQNAEIQNGFSAHCSRCFCRLVFCFVRLFQTSPLCILHSCILHLFKRVALRPPQQRHRGEGGDIHCGRAVPVPHQHKGPGQVVPDGHHPARLLRPLQKLPGFKGPAGVVQIEDAQNVFMGDHHGLAQMQVHKVPSFFPHSALILWIIFYVDFTAVLFSAFPKR